MLSIFFVLGLRFGPCNGLVAFLLGVFGAKVDIGDLFLSVFYYGWELGLDEAFDVGERLLWVDEECEGLDGIVGGYGSSVVGVAVVAPVFLDADR